jgi:hypothetical protein
MAQLTLPVARPARLASRLPPVRPTGGSSGAVYDLDFQYGGASSTDLTAAGFTFARTGTAWGEDGTAFATGVPRIIPRKGLLIEGARTNSIRNNSMTGAVAGTPGTVPTNWAIAAGTGLSAQIVGTGTIGGFTYLDVRVHGTAGSTTGCTFLPDGATQIAAVSGQTWTASWFWAFVGGTFANSTNLYFSIDERDSGAVGLAASNLADSRSSITASLQRASLSRTLNNGSTAAVSTSVRFFVTNGAAIDATFRLAAPQLELGAFASSPILTTTTAVTRAAETCTATRVAATLLSGTVLVDGTMPPGITSGVNQYLWAADDTTTSNRVILFANTSNIQSTMTAGGSLQGNLTITTPSVGGGFKFGHRWAANNLGTVLNGGSVGTDTSATVPSVTVERLGHASIATQEWYGYIRRVRRYPTAWNDSELQLATAGYDLDFASGAATAADLAVAGFATTRATTAWDHLGRSYASGAARVVPGRGLLVEGARTNLCLRSQEFDNATWTAASSLVVTANNVIAPDGTLTADTLTEGAAGSLLRTTSAITIVAGTTYTASVYLKRGNTDWVRFITGADTTTTDRANIWVNLATGALGTQNNNGTGVTGATPTITAIGAGWYRVSLTFSTSSATTAYLYLNTAASDNSGTRANVGGGAGIGGTLLAWQAQLEAGAFAGTPIVTTSASVVRNGETHIATRVAATLAQGSVLIAATAAPGGDGLNSQHAWIIDDGTGSNRARVYRSLSNNAGMMVHAAAVIQADLVPGAVAHRAVHRTASRWVTNNVAMSLDGAAPSTDAVATIPSMTAERLGHYIDGSAQLWGYLRRVQRVTDLWDDATLARVSNGYDLPFALGATVADLAGAGFTFTRASTAYDLLGNAYGTNQPRITPGKGLRIEGARTNLVTTSNSFAGFFPFEVTIAAANAVDPSGALTAAKLTKTANAFANIAHSGITVTNGSTYAASCYFKAGTLTKAVLRLYDGASIDVGILVNLATSAVTTFSGTPAASGIEAIGSGWYRAWFTAALAGTSTSVYVYPDDPNLTASGDVYAAFCQLELGTFPSTPILTTGTSATRAADVCSAARTSGLLSQGTVLLEATAAPGFTGTGTAAVLYRAYDAIATNRVVLFRDNTGGTLSYGVTGVTTTTASALAANTSFRVAASWNSTRAAVSRGGATATGVAGTWSTVPLTESLGTNAATAGSEWYGHIRRVYRTGEVWSDARLKAASYGAVL